MPFLPDSPLTIAYAVALLVAVLIAARGGWLMVPAIAVMVANWLGTRAVTAFDLGPWVAFGVDLGSLMALLVASRLMPRAMAVLPLAAIFAHMLFSYVAHDFGLIGRETMWAWADVGAYGQLVIMAGTGAGGGHLVGLADMAFGRRGMRGVADPVAEPVPHNRDT